MKAAVWHAPKDIRIEEVAAPSPRPHEAMIRVESVGLCGSDVHYYLDGCIGAQVLEAPTILGHEYAGEVVEMGSAADARLLGKRVAVEPGIPCHACEACRTGHYNVCTDMFFPGGPGCNGSLCEYMCVHADYCFPVPQTMPPAEAALIEPVAVALHTVELAQIKPGETAAIIGLGPIGLLTAQIAKHAGISVLHGCDLLDYRVAAAQRFGVDSAFRATDPGAAVKRILAETGGRGVDVGIDCTNASAGLAMACEVTRPAGRCVLTGISGEDYDPVPVSAVRRRELVLRWCRRFRHNFPRAIALVAGGTVDVRGLLTHTFPLEQTGEAFALLAETRDNVLKISIDS